MMTGRLANAGLPIVTDARHDTREVTDMDVGRMSVEWARQFFTDPKYSARTAIDIYANWTGLGEVARYYLGCAVREFTQGE